MKKLLAILFGSRKQADEDIQQPPCPICTEIDNCYRDSNTEMHFECGDCGTIKEYNGKTSSFPTI